MKKIEEKQVFTAVLKRSVASKNRILTDIRKHNKTPPLTTKREYVKSPPLNPLFSLD